MNIMNCDGCQKRYRMTMDRWRVGEWNCVVTTAQNFKYDRKHALENCPCSYCLVKVTCGIQQDCKKLKTYLGRKVGRIRNDR